MGKAVLYVVCASHPRHGRRLVKNLGLAASRNGGIGHRRRSAMRCGACVPPFRFLPGCCRSFVYNWEPYVAMTERGTFFPAKNGTSLLRYEFSLVVTLIFLARRVGARVDA